MVENIFAPMNVEMLNEHRKNLLVLGDNKFFTKMVDELVDFAEFDPELKDGIKWLDEKAQAKGITFYDMVFEVLYKHDTKEKARDWLNSRN